MAAAHMNGQRGVVTAVNVSTGRVNVKLENGQTVALKRDNLEIPVVSRPSPQKGPGSSEGDLVGKEVTVQGLSAAHMNGQQGTVQSFNPANGRFNVLLTSSQTVALKRENLVVALSTTSSWSGSFGGGGGGAESGSSTESCRGGGGGSSMEGGGTCVICIDRAPTHVIVPCGHKALCATCNDAHKYRECPLCKAQVQMTMRVFD